MPALAFSLFLAAAPLSVADSAAFDKATTEIFAPYTAEAYVGAPWERDIWSREVRRLITDWEKVQPEDEPDAMNDGDWLCQCQDWDAAAFRVTIGSREAIEPDAAEVGVAIVIFDDAEPRNARLSFRREEGRWMLDDLFTEEYQAGIKASLRETILEDQKLRDQTR